MKKQNKRLEKYVKRLEKYGKNLDGSCMDCFACVLHHLEEKLVSEWLYYGLVYWRENSHC